MNIISIDPGSESMGIYMKTKTGGSVCTIHPKDLHDLHYQLYCLISDNAIDFAFIEDYAYGQQLTMPGRKSIVEHVGVIKFSCEEQGVKYIKVPIATWRAYMIHGFPDKKKKPKQYTAAVNKYYKKEFHTADEADSWMIFGAMWMIGQGALKTKASKELKKKIDEIGVFNAV
jgi:hypothetical protein